jgi:hypothetical protein
VPDKLQEAMLGGEVMVVRRQVLGKPANLVRQQGYLHFGRPGVALFGSVFADEFSLLFLCLCAQSKPLLFFLFIIKNKYSINGGENAYLAGELTFQTERKVEGNRDGS